MNNINYYRNAVDSLRNKIIDDIATGIKNAGYNLVELRSGIVIKEDSDRIECIEQINALEKTVLVRDGFDDEYDLKFNELTIDQLILIYEQIEKKEFDEAEE